VTVHVALGLCQALALSTSTAREARGKGKTAATTNKTEEFSWSRLFVASTHDYLMVFSDRGKGVLLKVHEIPEAGRASRASRSST